MSLTKKEKRFRKIWGRPSKGKILVNGEIPKKKKSNKDPKDKNKKFELTDEVKEQYNELNKLHHVDNPSTEECPCF